MYLIPSVAVTCTLRHGPRQPSRWARCDKVALCDDVSLVYKLSHTVGADFVTDGNGAATVGHTSITAMAPPTREIRAHGGQRNSPV
jgi:hypothetical protein